MPVNVEHRHYNSDSAHSARLLYITSFPFMLQVFGSMGLINDLNFNFNERYDGAPIDDKVLRVMRARPKPEMSDGN